MRCQARKGHIDMNNNRRSCLRKQWRFGTDEGITNRRVSFAGI